MSDALDQALAFFDQAETKLPRNQRPGEGFFTARELAAKKGCAITTMKMKLDKMVSAGLAETAEGMVKQTKSNYYRIFSAKPVASTRSRN